MTTHTTTPTPCCPRPRWAVLRDASPEICDDLTDAWARIEALTLTTNDSGGHLTELRWTIEHLATLIEDHFATRPDDVDEDDWLYCDEPDPVFRPDDWHNPSPGHWEATTDPEDDVCFEAAVTVNHGYRAWNWTLYRPDGDDLEPLGTGQAHTLTNAQHQADALARRWRETPDAMETARRSAGEGRP